ncbi:MULTISPECIES: hypothetical protein [Streptomyces]|uniref:DUF3040 domain-containing protein n=1 Tax=Streptomyces lycii TaxID=2654337 RepID=A0ABQ7FIL4_9ACTN|nr:MULTISPECIES: hypothetical protein [Streptomyces]KAF4408819.1 hypothetical protein GCU69_12275 [Streptomyces lycii]PGH47433.1 hypothetical protein CRI70_28510 [Streptomyces sp. Ru87]
MSNVPSRGTDHALVQHLRKADADIVEHQTGDEEDWAATKAAILRLAVADEDSGEPSDDRTVAGGGPSPAPGLVPRLLSLVAVAAGTAGIALVRSAWGVLLGAVLIVAAFGSEAAAFVRPRRVDARGEPGPGPGLVKTGIVATAATAGLTVAAAVTVASGRT